MARPSPTNQREVAFVSPDLGDLLFWEHVSMSREDETSFDTHPKYAYGSPHPDTSKYPNHEVVYLQHSPDYDPRGSQDSKIYRVYYAKVRGDQDQYNFEFTSTTIGGQEFDAVQRTYITKRDSFLEASPVIGSTMSREPSNRFPDSYILAERRQSRIGTQELDSLYVVERRVYVKVSTITSVATDSFFGGPLTTTRTLYYRGQDYEGSPIETQISNSSLWGVQGDGTSVSVKQLSNDWWAVTTQDIVPQGEGGGVRSYTTIGNFSWPAIISSASIVISSAERKDGTTQTVAKVVPDKEAYNGPTKFAVTQTWSATPTTPASPIYFDVKSASYSGVQYAVSFRNSLVNGAIDLIDTIGTGDPVFKPGAYGGPWVTSSSQTSWGSGSVLVDVKQEPFRGGYLVTETRATPPS